MPQCDRLVGLTGRGEELREIDDGAVIAYIQVFRWSVAQIELQFDERNRAAQLSGLQRIVAQRFALPDFAVVAVADPTLLIVCRESRTSPIASVHRAQSPCTRAWRHSGDYSACRGRIAEVEIHRHGGVKQQ